jgi:hypothetical protein
MWGKNIILFLPCLAGQAGGQAGKPPAQPFNLKPGFFRYKFHNNTAGKFKL